MTLLKENAYQKIADLTERFTEQYDSYKRSDYNETLTRRDFIDPFFKALGWDIDNEQGSAESYREVIHEDKVKVGSETKAPDYSFRLGGGKRLFFVEAKKPSIHIKDDIAPAYQVRRYGWSAKLPISILTDFEEFAVYDCTQKPNPTDKASTARIKILNYSEYLKDFDFIWNTFSKERVLKGSFDQFVQNDTYKKGTATVDKEFLQSLDSWRTHLARSISWNNKDLDEDEINFAVQQTIDRIIFLRIAEGRSVEPYGSLRDCIRQGNLYENLFHLFVKADEKYNSGLFDFDKDKISHKLEVDNKVIKTIITELYYPCPYAFGVLPVEILGTAYEQFLGKIIRITPGHIAKIEEKPEVRKAGGVYYTPQYIVDYIVNNTVGKLIEGKTPKEISKIKIVDPACGSGSFLLGAYQYLLDWHKKQYLPKFEELTQINRSSKHTEKQKNDARKERSKLPLTPAGELTTTLKKEILLNNIFGVDIDTNAVEVTKLSLLLKCMDGETQNSIAQSISFGERILPTLDNNIKSGNSLIDTDYYDTHLDFGDERKIKPFHWQQAFPDVFKQGGFNAVIGNPPYGALFNIDELDYLKLNFKTAVGRVESYLLFIEKALHLLITNGLLGFIIPDTLLNLGFTQSARECLLCNSKLKEIVSLPSNVFSGVTVDTILVFTEKQKMISDFYRTEVEIKVFSKKTTISIVDNPDRIFKANTRDWFIQHSFNLQANSSEQSVVGKIEINKRQIKDIANMFSGIKAYSVGRGTPIQTEKIRDSKPYTSITKLDGDWSPFYDGKHIGRYTSYWDNNNWIKYGVNLAEPRKPENFKGEKILIRKIIGKTLISTYIPTDSYCNTLLHVLKLKDTTYSYQSILAILNSALIGWYFRKKFQISDEDTFPQIMIRDILLFPIPVINFKIDNELTKNVNLMLKLNNEVKEVKLQNKVEQIQSHISHCEDKINEIVYQLYGLTEDEIQVVEAGR